MKIFSSKFSQKNEPEQIIPLIPLILGGDDLTVVCEGKYALEFSKCFLENFEEETTKSQQVGSHQINVIPEIARAAFNNINRLSACAGVAIIKPHFPFSVAYQLTEKLMNRHSCTIDPI